MDETASASELMVTLLLGDRASAERAARATSARGLWPNAVEMARVWRLLPRLRARTAELGIMLDTPVATALAQAAAAAAAQSLLIYHRSADGLAALERAGIRAAAFKGVAMIAGVYGTPGKRMLNDADVLVRASDLRPALATLSAAGFEAELSLDLEQWLDLLDERVYPLHDYLELSDGDGTTIDLHWRISTAAHDGLTTEDVLERALPATLGGKTFRIVSPEDSMLLTAYHAVRDRLVPQSAVKDFCDLRAWLDDAPGRCDLDAAIARAGRCGLANALLAGWSVLVRLDPGGIAGDPARRLASTMPRESRKAVERLVELFFLQLREGAVSEAMLGLSAMTPKLLGRFVVSRIHSLTNPTYDAHKFGHHPDTRMWPKLRRLARELLRATPRRLAAYRALARENRGFISDKTRD